MSLDMPSFSSRMSLDTPSFSSSPLQNRLSNVCRRFSNICSDDSVWRSAFETRYGHSNVPLSWYGSVMGTRAPPSHRMVVRSRPAMGTQTSPSHGMVVRSSVLVLIWFSRHTPIQPPGYAELAEGVHQAHAVAEVSRYQC